MAKADEQQLALATAIVNANIFNLSATNVPIEINIAIDSLIQCYQWMYGVDYNLIEEEAIKLVGTCSKK